MRRLEHFAVPQDAQVATHVRGLAEAAQSLLERFALLNLNLNPGDVVLHHGAAAAGGDRRWHLPDHERAALRHKGDQEEQDVPHCLGRDLFSYFSRRGVRRWVSQGQVVIRAQTRLQLLKLFALRGSKVIRLEGASKTPCG